jgi:hypothetical protein
MTSSHTMTNIGTHSVCHTYWHTRMIFRQCIPCIKTHKADASRIIFRQCIPCMQTHSAYHTYSQTRPIRPGATCNSPDRRPHTYWHTRPIHPAATWNSPDRRPHTYRHTRLMRPGATRNSPDMIRHLTSWSVWNRHHSRMCRDSQASGCILGLCSHSELSMDMWPL